MLTKVLVCIKFVLSLQHYCGRQEMGHKRCTQGKKNKRIMKRKENINMTCVLLFSFSQSLSASLFSLSFSFFFFHCFIIFLIPNLHLVFFLISTFLTHFLCLSQLYFCSRYIIVSLFRFTFLPLSLCFLFSLSFSHSLFIFVASSKYILIFRSNKEELALVL